MAECMLRRRKSAGKQFVVTYTYNMPTSGYGRFYINGTQITMSTTYFPVSQSVAEGSTYEVDLWLTSGVGCYIYLNGTNVAARYNGDASYSGKITSNMNFKFYIADGDCVQCDITTS